MTTPAARLARAVPRLADQVERWRAPDGALRLRAEVRRTRLHRLLAKLVGAPRRIEVELDELGAYVVERLDGRPLAALADDLAAHLKLGRREAEVALGDFLAALQRRRLVVLEPCP